MLILIFVTDGVIKCQYCDCICDNWLPPSDPIVEHIRKNNTCAYIRLYISQDIIDDITSNFLLNNEEEENIITIESDSDTDSVMTIPSSTHIRETQEQLLPIALPISNDWTQATPSQTVINNIIEEGNNNSTITQDNTASKCVICLTNTSIYASIPCGHLILCNHCNSNCTTLTCPICRCQISKTLRIFFA